MLSRNPFFLGKIDRDQAGHFYNRDSEVREALRRLRNSENIEVTGARKIGKTWFLWYLSQPSTLEQNRMDPQHDIFVYIDCQRQLIQQEKPVVYKTITKRIVDAVGRGGVDLGLELRDSPASGKAFERVLKQLSRRGLRTVLLLDEFEEMAQNPDLDIGFFSHLRALWSADDIKVAYVTASCSDLVTLFSKRRFLGSPLFDIFRPIQLGLFDQQDSRYMVKDSLRKADVNLPEEMLELVLKMGGGHPFFLQMAGYHAFDLLIEGEELTKDKHSIFLDKVNVEATEHFQSYWQGLEEEEQYVLAALPLLWQEIGYKETIDHLRAQCLIRNYDYFSPLFEAFVRRREVSDLLQLGPLVVDKRRGQVLLRGERLDLTPTNYALLTCLMERAGQVVSCEELWQAAWSGEPYCADQPLKSAIKSLRKALGDDADCVVNRWGVGYMLQFHLE